MCLGRVLSTPTRAWRNSSGCEQRMSGGDTRAPTSHHCAVDDWPDLMEIEMLPKDPLLRQIELDKRAERDQRQRQEEQRQKDRDNIPPAGDNPWSPPPPASSGLPWWAILAVVVVGAAIFGRNSPSSGSSETLRATGPPPARPLPPIQVEQSPESEVEQAPRLVETTASQPSSPAVTEAAQAPNAPTAPMPPVDARPPEAVPKSPAGQQRPRVTDDYVGG